MEKKCGVGRYWKCWKGSMIQEIGWLEQKMAEEEHKTWHAENFMMVGVVETRKTKEY